MWKWILIIITPFIILAVLEEIMNYIVYRLTGEKRERRIFKKKTTEPSDTKQRSQGS